MFNTSVKKIEKSTHIKLFNSLLNGLMFGMIIFSALSIIYVLENKPKISELNTLIQKVDDIKTNAPKSKIL